MLTRIVTTPLYDQDGNFNGALGILSDISRQKDAEEPLKVKDMLNAIAKSSGIAMCLINPDFTIEWYNDLDEKWVGPLAKTKGRNCYEVFDGRDTICEDCPSRLSFEQGLVATSMRTNITTSAGANRIITRTISPVKDGKGNVIQVVEIAQDITEQKQAEEKIRDDQIEFQRLLAAADVSREVLLSVVEDQHSAEAKLSQLNAELEERIHERTIQLEAANQELEAFSYSVSHDLRAPLRGIDGWSLALSEDYRDQLDENGRQYIDHVRGETQRMGQLIDDLLNLSRVTRIEMKRCIVDLTKLAQTVAARLQRENPQRLVEFVIQPELTATGDPNLLEIVLTNLLDNAYKFTGKQPQPLIEFGQIVLDGKLAYFIRDNGAGFNMEHAKNLFGAFQRMHKQSDFPGTGIGLTTVQRIIRRHGGEVWVEARKNEGATFYFTHDETA